MTRGVAITGIGAVTPLGVGAQALHERWAAGESGISDGLGRCSDFEPTDHLTRRQVRRTDRFTQLALAAAAEAIEQAGLDEAPYDRAEIGSVMGTGIGGLSTIESEHITLREKGQRAVSPHCVPQMMANSAAGAVEGVAMLQALRAKQAPPTLNYEEPDEGLDLDYVPGEAKELDLNGHPAIGISNSFGFGGHNVVLVMEAAA
jgi:3-oxoacyl-(acyl-carrier-protein) synthase